MNAIDILYAAVFLCLTASVILFTKRVDETARVSSAYPWSTPVSASRVGRKIGRRTRNLTGLAYSVAGLVLYAVYYGDRVPGMTSVLRVPLMPVAHVAHGHPHFRSGVLLAVIIACLYAVRATFGRLLKRKYESLNDNLAPFLAGICLVLILAFTVRGAWSFGLLGDAAILALVLLGYALSNSRLISNLVGTLTDNFMTVVKRFVPFIKTLGKRLVLVAVWIKDLPSLIPELLAEPRRRAAARRAAATAQAGTVGVAIDVALGDANRKASDKLENE